MKKQSSRTLLVCVVAVILGFNLIYAMSQTGGTSSVSVVNDKPSKAVKNEVKRLKKEGWKTSPGSLPLEQQLDRSFKMQQEIDADLLPVYLIGEGMSIGENYDAAKMQASEMARQRIVSQIEAELTALIETNVANSQIEADEAASLTKSALAAKTLMSQSLGRTLPIVETYRTLPNGNKEVLVRLAYNSKSAKAAAKKAIRAGLETEGEHMQQTLDNILGW